MSFPLVLSLLVLVGPIPAVVLSEHHVIDIRTPTLRLSSLAWDPISTHFVVGSAVSPTIHAISDAGVVEHLISETSAAGSASSVAAVAVDSIRRRLIVAFSNPASIAAYDLKSSYRRFFTVPLPEMDTEPGGVAVDLATGEVFVSGVERAVVWRVGLEGEVRVLSEFKKYGDEGLRGIVHVSRGYLIVLQPTTGKVFKVDSEDGAIKEVLSTSGTNQLAPSGQTLSLHHDLSLIVSTNQTLLLLKSDDSWAQAGVRDKFNLEKGETAVGVAVRDGKAAYVLLKSENEEYRIEEVKWGRENDDMMWGLGLLGLGFAYFMVWRFQMGKLASNLNKKRN